MAEQVVTRTYTASIQNQSQMQNHLNLLGFAILNPWNVGRWVYSRIWDEIDRIAQPQRTYHISHNPRTL